MIWLYRVQLVAIFLMLLSGEFRAVIIKLHKRIKSQGNFITHMQTIKMNYDVTKIGNFPEFSREQQKYTNIINCYENENCLIPLISCHEHGFLGLRETRVNNKTNETIFEF